MTDTDPDFPTPRGFDVDNGERPGKPLHPGENTIVDRGNHPLQQGEVIRVWMNCYADGHGTETVTGELQVVGDDGDGDIFAMLAGESPLEASRVYRLAGDLSRIQAAVIVPVPSYDSEEGVFTVTHDVQVRGHRKRDLIEARSLETRDHWGGGREL